MGVQSNEPTAPPSFIDYASQPPPYQPLAKSNEMSLNASMPHTVVNVSNQPASVVYVGGCPSCRVGVLRESHCTFCGILWSILLFPIGLLCLCCCTKQRCTNCSYSQ